MKFKKLITIALIAILSTSLVSCKSSDNSKNTKGNDKTIIVGASPNPHSEILNNVVKPLLEKEGYTIEVKIFNDYVLPNKALTEKSIDANYFQHIPYLDEYNKKNNSDITYTEKIHLEPMGIYSKKISNISELKDGAIVAVPNDPTNESRALRILEKEGLIKLADKELLTKNDIVENPKNLQIKEMAAEQLPTALQDVDIDIINSNFALQAKLNPVKDALVVEDKDSPYSNILAVRPDNKESEKIKVLTKALTSEDVKKYIEEKYEGAIIPSFK